ncbi:MAG: ferritin-like domain-containing protein [Chitinophagaceae bacterium]
MKFNEWKNYFLQNQYHFADIDFDLPDQLSEQEKSLVYSSLQQFQRGEHSEGKHLFAFAKRFPDPEYLECIKLFIPEEQMHAIVLAKFLKKNKIPLIRHHWVDAVFRWLRKLAGIENTVRVLLIAEIVAKVYYRGLHDATNSVLLKKICNQILRDEDQHIRFQCDALRVFFKKKSMISKLFTRSWQYTLMTGTSIVVWMQHRKVLKKSGYSFHRYFALSMNIFSEAERSINREEQLVTINDKMAA